MLTAHFEETQFRGTISDFIQVLAEIISRIFGVHLQYTRHPSTNQTGLLEDPDSIPPQDS